MCVVSLILATCTRDILLCIACFVLQMVHTLRSEIYMCFLTVFIIHLLTSQACWMMHYFSEVIFSDQANLQFGLQQVHTKTPYAVDREIFAVKNFRQLLRQRKLNA